jgi:hypothetical protein
MQKIVLLVFISGFLSINNASAQDTLPDFTVKNFGQKRIVVSWKNTYPLVKQIGIQRSLDSLRNYKTILTVADPMLPENGFFDSRPQTDSMFYRLFIVLDKGDFLFTDPQRPVLDTTKQVVMEQQTATDQKSLIAENKPSNTEQIYNNVTIKSNDSSIVINSFDSTSLTKQGKKPNIYIPSVFVFTQKDGYIQINLPDADTKNYSIKFFEEDDRFLFELKDIVKSNLKLDRTAFYHSGWFKFELFENNKIIEKNKFFLAKDF